MLVTKPYDRLHALKYAQKWALERNPLFYDFADIGGDCTNFVSQCLYAGSCVMNYTPIYGWYFLSIDDRSASWTGVEYLYRFLIENKGEGPFATQTDAEQAEAGDVIQLGNADGTYYHSLMITGVQGNTFLVAAHNNDVLNRRLSTYRYDRIRYLHIQGVRLVIADTTSCFEALYAGTSIESEGNGSTAETTSEQNRFFTDLTQSILDL